MPKKILAKITKEEAEDFERLRHTKSVIFDLLEEAGRRKRLLLKLIAKKYNIPKDKGFRVDDNKKVIIEF